MLAFDISRIQSPDEEGIATAGHFWNPGVMSVAFKALMKKGLRLAVFRRSGDASSRRIQSPDEEGIATLKHGPPSRYAQRCNESPDEEGIATLALAIALLALDVATKALMKKGLRHRGSASRPPSQMLVATKALMKKGLRLRWEPHCHIIHGVAFKALMKKGLRQATQFSLTFQY